MRFISTFAPLRPRAHALHGRQALVKIGRDEDRYPAISPTCNVVFLDWAPTLADRRMLHTKDAADVRGVKDDRVRFTAVFAPRAGRKHRCSSNALADEVHHASLRTSPRDL